MSSDIIRGMDGTESLKQPLIDCQFGYDFESLVESDEGVTATLTK